MMVLIDMSRSIDTKREKSKNPFPKNLLYGYSTISVLTVDCTGV